MATSMVRQNYDAEVETAVNKQINNELKASYVYQSMAFYFDREDVALKGFYKFFKKCSEEEREHAEKLMKYQNLRGGSIVLDNVAKPEKSAWGTGLEAMEAALALERTVTDQLLALHKLASAKEDPHLTNYLEDEFIKEQAEAAKRLADYITNLKRVGPGLGEYMFDKKTLDD